ncbi:cell division protein FtsQ/DivIB [Aurantimonas sp. MSK8Z-1]|uniref:cell division protein FtsQ/DivIB n=1 Tax=Mangrovibrevibacter kandeliae TaxID=2968473 RepID=UPI0021198297|nr:cell division protein FtsQ/DivIB [Aurantimonas sp. MSK8Z-1]MCW4116685.1 cell division protein FtsQ/DivIB [Aurantimonas sp. MSK8Z-1]
MPSMKPGAPVQVKDGALRRLALRASIMGRRLAIFSEDLGAVRAPGFGAVAAVFLGVTGLYGVALGGHTMTVVDGVGQPLGFAIDNIDVKGNHETSEIDILQTLWGTGAQSLLSLDPGAARQALEAMPWIEKASVAKVYPDRVAIDLAERKPFALWQNGQELFIVDRDGRPIVPFGADRFSNLPLVVGTGAETHAAEFLDQLEVLPELRARVRAYIRVGGRRWDLRLDNGVTVRLPEEQPVEAAAEVARMDREEGLLSRDIAAVDMRIEDRMVIKLTPDAVVRRNAALKARQKLIARSEKDKPV